jgi:hypothetical protein
MECYGKIFSRKPTRSSAYLTKRLVMQYPILSITYERADIQSADVTGSLSAIRA